MNCSLVIENPNLVRSKLSHCYRATTGTNVCLDGKQDHVNIRTEYVILLSHYGSASLYYYPSEFCILTKLDPICII